MDDLSWMPGWRLRDRILEGEIGPVEVVRHFLERIERIDGTIHSFLTVAPDALAAAGEAEKALKRGDPPGPLFGIPVSLKDHIATAGLRTTSGSRIYATHVPERDSLCAARLRRAGAIIVGKTNLPEFGLYWRTRNKLGPETLNPWDTGRTPGGSSGGAGASVAAGLTPLAIGSDRGGSSRIPAAFCGVVGMVASHGRIPVDPAERGSLFFTSIGPVTRDVRDAATLLEVLAQPDRRDPLGVIEMPARYSLELEQGSRQLRVAWWSDLGDVEGVDQRVVDTARASTVALEEWGAAVSAPDLNLRVETLRDVFFAISQADRWEHAQALWEDPAQRALLTDYGRASFAAHTDMTVREFTAAMRARVQLIGRLRDIFDDYDVLLSPTVGLVAPRLDDDWGTTGIPVIFNAYTYFVNLAGLTAASVLCGFVDGMPVGLHVVGPPGGEATVLRVCRALEERLSLSTQFPSIADRVTQGG